MVPCGIASGCEFFARQFRLHFLSVQQLVECLMSLLLKCLIVFVLSSLVICLEFGQSSIMSHLRSQSLDSMAGLLEQPIPTFRGGSVGTASPIKTVGCLQHKLDQMFANKSLNKKERKNAINKLLEAVDLDRHDIRKYAFFDEKVPYTRNLISCDGENYSLLMLCWTPGRESRIHDHPCDGCYVKVLRGSIKETRYSVNPRTDAITPSSEIIATAGSITFMNDDIGLHKIGNPSKELGAVSLHLYTPPFKTCKVSNDCWAFILTSC